MQKDLLTAGRLLLALSLFFIGLVHLIAGHFPLGLVPVPESLPGRTFLAYFTGCVISVAALAMVLKKNADYGIIAGGLVLLIILLAVHVPLVAQHISNPSIWTGFFEIVSILAGLCLLFGLTENIYSRQFILTGRWAFILSLIVFGILHCLYFQFIETLIPAWLPVHTFWGVLVIVGFFGAAASFITGMLTRYAAVFLCTMFLLWFVVLHLPRAFSKPNIEPEWTSAFVALAMSGIALLAGASCKTKAK